MKYLLINILFIMISQTSLAAPISVEVWFLTMDEKTSLYESLKKIEGNVTYSKLYALTDCVPMGDGCFHPQMGYIEDKPRPGAKKKKTETFERPKTINAMDVNLIKCDKNNYFDIYCGKAKGQKKAKASGFEIWVDVSSSLKQFDFSKEAGFCKRRTFISTIMSGCPGVNVSVFNTSIKELGAQSGLCETYGMNDTKRMIRWIENSNAKRLLIITDIDEFNLEFGGYLNSIQAKIKGEGPNGFTVSDLVNSSDKVISYCKKL